MAGTIFGRTEAATLSFVEPKMSASWRWGTWRPPDRICKDRSTAATPQTNAPLVNPFLGKKP
jgi:hypothetical protein